MSKEHPTPLRAIRLKCLDCCGDSPLEVRECTAAGCILWPWKSGKTPVSATMTALKTIRQKCLKGCGEDGATSEVRDCKLTDCPLHPFRLGTNPNISVSTRKKLSNIARQRHTRNSAQISNSGPCAGFFEQETLTERMG